MPTMQSYDALCMEPVPNYSSATIRALRTRHKLSQAATPVIYEAQVAHEKEKA